MSYYQTTCPRCHTNGLILTRLSTVVSGVSITREGFDLSEATSIATGNAIVRCEACSYEGPLDHDAPTFDDNAACRFAEHGCRHLAQVCGCRCDSCIDESEPRCNVCNTRLEHGKCPVGKAMANRPSNPFQTFAGFQPARSFRGFFRDPGK